MAFWATWPKRLALMKTVIAAWLLLLLILMGFRGYTLTLQDRSIVRHDVIIGALKKHVESGKQVPRSLSELRPLVVSTKEQRSVKYYADAWNQAGRILLRSSILGSYVVTFGNGSLAVLSHWRYKPEQKQTGEANLSGEEHHLRMEGFLGTFPALVLLILAIASFFIIVIVERIIKKKTSKERTAA